MSATTSTAPKKDAMSQNTDNDLDTAAVPEVKNPAALLAKNKELLATVAQLKTELEAARAALTTAQDDAGQWRTKWHESAVVAPFEALLATATSLPTKYLREGLIERGIVKMLADEDGIERPTWHDAKGSPMDVPTAPWRYLADLKDDGLNAILRSSGTTGSGATPGFSSSGSAPAAKPTPPAAPKAPAYGLR